MEHIFQKKRQIVLWTLPVAAYFIFALPAFASYISPSGTVYPGASYSVNEDITNSSSVPITVHNDWAYSVNGSALNWNWCSKDTTIPAGATVTVSCGSTGDVAGTVMGFPVTTWWNPWTVTWSTTGFTVQARPATVSASLSPTGDVYPNASLSLSGTVSGSGYSGTNCWAYSVNGGARSCWFSPGSGIGNFSYNWNAGAADPNTTYTFYLCTDSGAGVCSTAGSLRVVNPPPPSFDYSLSQQTSAPTLVQGNAAVVYFTTTLSSNATQGVTLSLSGLPSGISYTVSPSATQNPSATYEVTLTASGSATVGTFPITVTGTPLNKTTSFNLTVAAPTVDATLSSSDSSVVAGGTLNFSASVIGTATGAITYSGQSCGGGNLFGNNPSSNSFSCTYPSTGNYTAKVTVTRQGVSASAEKIISVTAPPNTLYIRTSVDGVELDPGQTVSYTDSSQNAGIYPTPSTVESPSLIDISFSAPPSYSGNTFLGWSGCDGVGNPRRCFVRVGNGGTKTVIINDGSENFQPKLSAGTGSLKVDGARYKEKAGVYVTNVTYAANIYAVATFSNSGQYGAEGVSYSFKYSTDNGLNYYPATIKDGPWDSNTKSYVWPDAIPVNSSVKIWAGLGFAPGTYLVKVCAQPVNAVAETCTPGASVIVENPPPPPVSPCFVYFDNTNTPAPNDDMSTKTKVTATGCAGDRWSELSVSANASTNNSANTVLDYGFGGWRKFGGNAVTRDAQWEADSSPTRSFTGLANLANNSGITSAGGNGIGFGPKIWTGGNWSWGPVDLLSKYSTGYIGYGTQSTKLGLYSYRVEGTFTGRFKCFTAEYRSYKPASNSFTKDSEYSEYYPPIELNGKLQSPLTLNPYLNLCYSRNNTTGDYYKASCGDSKTPVTAPVFCSSGTVDGPTVEIKGKLPTPTPVVRPHTLNIQSKLDNASAAGVNITQIANSLTPPDVKPFEASDFGGTTDYQRTTERNYTVTLEAPQNHSAAAGNFSSWSGCDTQNDRLCTISFKYIEPNGGKTKTVIANYSGTLDAPVVLTSTPECTAGVGKIQVWWNAVPNATSYKLYRSAAVAGGAAPNRFAAVAYAQSGVEIGAFSTPPTQANPFVDTNLSAGIKYDYQVKAFGASGVSSPPSATKQDDASKRCPDLIVQSITLPNSAGYPVGTVLSASGPHTFSAVIKNQGEGTDTTKTFFNRIKVGSEVVDNPLNPDQKITGGITAAGTSGDRRTVTSGPWTADIVTTATTKTIEVCADQPPGPVPGTAFAGRIFEAPPTGIPPTGNPAEENNCASANIATTIIIIPPPITIQLEVEKAGTNTYRSDYVVVDYEDLANLRWKLTGNPTECKAATGTDWTGGKTNQSYDISGNPFSLPKLIDKLKYLYQLDCTR
ncbi:MAG: hypothetical protein Q8R17_02770 [bacterium]|nr:hypothetical protein [bacterium]